MKKTHFDKHVALYSVLLSAVLLGACSNGSDFQGTPKEQPNEAPTDAATVNPVDLGTDSFSGDEPLDASEPNTDSPNSIDPGLVDDPDLFIGADSLEQPLALRYVGCSVDEDLEINLNGDEQTTLSGEICLDRVPGEVSKATVMFVIDTSGSMEGSDPGAFDCSRAQATQAIVDRLIDDLPDQSSATQRNVEVGLILFSAQATITQRPVSLDRFVDRLPDLTFDICNAFGGTNYEDALLTAKDIFEDVDSESNTVYFISDGLPTQDQSNPNPSIANLAEPGYLEGVERAGLDAADELLDLEQNVVLNAVFLQPPLDDSSLGSIYGPGFEPTDPKSYLRDLTNEEESGQTRVELAEDASELATKIVQLKAAPSVRIDPTAIRVSFASDETGVNIDLAIAEVNVVDESDDQLVVRYVTEAFSPVEAGTTSDSGTITVEAEGPGAEAYKEFIGYEIFVAP